MMPVNVRKEQPAMPSGEWLTTRDVADEFKVNEETVRRWIRSGELPVLDLGAPRGGYRIKRADLEAFIASRYGPVGKDAA
jgi:excisionase family DNA binding protein